MCPLVLGQGPAALRAARVAGAGRFLDVGPAAPVPPDTGLPEGWGFHRATGEDRERIARVYGAAPAVAEPRCALRVRGRWLPVPWGPGSVARALGLAPGALAARERAGHAAHTVLRRMLGGGREERAWWDWARRTWGPTVATELIAPVVRRGWGPPRELAASAARTLHLPPAGRTGAARAALGASPRGGWEALSRGVERQVVGPEVGLLLREGAVAAIRTPEGRVAVEPPVWCAAAPARIVAWLGSEAPPWMRRIAAGLRLRTAWTVGIACSHPGALPDLGWLADDPRPVLAVQRAAILPGAPARLVLVHGVLDPLADHVDEDLEDAARAVLADLGAHPDGRAALGPWRRPEAIPVARVGFQPAHLRLVRRLVDWGIVPVGAAALFRLVDPVAELAYLDALRSGLPPLEAMRTTVDPPLRDPLPAGAARPVAV